MKTTSSRWIINPHSDDEKAIRDLTITTQAVILAAVIGVTLVTSTNKVVTLTLASMLIVTIFLARRGIVSPGQILTPIATAAVSVIFMIAGNGIHDIAAIGLVGSIIIAGLFLGSQGTAIGTVAAMLIFVALGIAEITDVINPTPPGTPLPEELVISALIFLAIGLILRVTLNRLKHVANLAKENESIQIETNKELRLLKDNLEARVEERTAALERRASQLDAISKVSRSILNIQDIDRLLPAIVTVVSEHFNFYHIGIFLLDERSEFAFLAAANSEGGQHMLQRRHRLKLGTTSIVGYAAAQGEARIALDVGADSVYFNNPDLPNTRSEIALPLKSGSDVIGVLDVQSTETNAFRSEDINVLSTLANQIATAIDNSRLFGRTRKALTDSQAVYDEYIKREWAQFGRRVGKIGFAYDGIRTMPIDSTASDADSPNARHITVKIRGVTVGTITVRSNDPERQLSQDEINLARAAAERAGLAIENIRLLDEAQRRAAKERTIGEISSRIATSIDMKDIMQTAVQELGKAMPGSEIILQFEEKG